MLAVFIIAVFLVAAFPMPRVVALVAPGLSGYTRWSVVSILELAVCLLAIMAIARTNPLGAFRELRLVRPVPVALLFALLATLPMPIAFALSGPLSDTVDPLRLLFFSGFAPLLEEIVFRGFAFWMLYRWVRLSFWPAALIPAVVFGLAHLYQASELMEALGIFVITAVGSLWFSWLLLRWDNLWVPAFMHMLMNGWWELFEVDSTALGGWMPTAARGMVILLSILVTVYREPLLSRFATRSTPHPSS